MKICKNYQTFEAIG